MKNKLWKLLDSINIYEIKEITFGSTAAFILIIISMCAISGICTYLIYVAFSELSIRTGVLSILATALVVKELIKQSAKNSYEYKKENGDDM